MAKFTLNRLVAVVSGAALTAATLVLAPSAAAVEDVETVRLAGTGRFATAADVAEAAYPAGADDVIVASGRAFPDALAGAALAGDLGAPILLTEPDRIPTPTAQALQDLGADTVHLLGGTAAVSEGVADGFRQAGYTVNRLAGTDRYETAAEIAEAIGATSVADHGGHRTAIVATGLDFADALAGGPLAAAGAGTGVHPILLVDRDVPAATEDAIADLGIEQVVILGGTAVVSKSVETELEALTGNPAVRLAGTNRYLTAVDVANAAIADFGFTAAEVLLANGEVFADALAGGPLGGLRAAPVLLTPANALASASRDFFELNSATVATITVLGGTVAVSDAVVAAAEAAAESDPPSGANETIDVGPRSSTHLPNGSTREFTVSGLAGTQVDIALVLCSSVSTRDGDTLLANTNGNLVADGTAQSGSAPDVASVADVRISEVNGTERATSGPTAPPNDDYADNATPDGGTVTFTVESAGSPLAPNNSTVCVVPVVFDDANVDNALNGTTAHPTDPTEAFGVGGPTTFSPTGAEAGQFDAHEVESTEKASNRFTACAITALGVADPNDCKTFVYDAEDNFQIDSEPVSFGVWEQALSAGDQVRGTYQPTGVSTFNLTDADQTDEDQPAGEPTITSALGSSPDGTADTDDVHELEFSEPVVTSAAAATYEVTDSDGTTATVDCADNALCTFDGDQTTLRARLTAAPAAGLQYPLTVTATNVEDADGNGIDLSASSDRVIEQETLTGDVEGPVITGADLTTDEGPANFNSVGDVMEVTFDDGLLRPADDSDVSEEQLEAMLGVSVVYGIGTVVTLDYVDATTNPTVVSLTISGNDFLLTQGVQVGQDIPGSGNTFVVDDARNPQAVNASPTTLTSSAS